jgi:hypothetical protein
MPIHPLIAARFPLISQISSLEESLYSPEAAQMKVAYAAPYASYSLPDVAIESTSISGPHGDIRCGCIVRPARQAGRYPVCCGCTAAPSSPVILTCPRPTW